MLKAFLLLLAAQVLAAGTLSVRIQDTTARVYLTNAQGQAFFPEGAIRYDKPGERNFVPPAGKFQISLAPDVYTLTVERGKETVPQTETITVPETGQVERSIQLRRWVDMASRGWYSADMHVHRALADLADLMEAEDLTAAIPITRWRTTRPGVNEDPDLRVFLERADATGIFHVNAGRFFPVINEELESRGSALLASWLGRNLLAPQYPLDRFGHEVQAAGGLSDSEKATSLELPALAATGAVNLIGLANNHLWRTTTNLGPWGAWPDRLPQQYPLTCRGFVQAGFDLYATLLNAGIPLKLSAGSASGVHPVPPGWSRVYVHPDGPLTPSSFQAALKDGRSFVTTGPMLLLTVNRTVQVEALSPTPIQSVEVVIDGVAHELRLRRSGKPNSYTGALKTDLKKSSWVVARWIGERAGTCDAAHTSPVYLKRPEVDRKAAAALLPLADRLVKEVEADTDLKGIIVLDSPEVRRETLEYFRKASEVYRQRAN